MTLDGQMKRDLKSLIGPYTALAVLLIVCCISDEHFRSAQNLMNITRQVSYSGLIALGMTFVIAAGGIDLSVGSILAMTGVLSILGMNLLPPEMEALGVLAAFGISVAAGTAAGAANGLLVSLGKIPPFIATLGTLSIFRSLALYFADAGMIASRNNIYRDLGSMEFIGIPLPTLVLLGFTILFAIILRNTRFGRHVCAVGSNEKVAFYSAIPTSRVKFYTYMLIGFTAGISAFLFGSRLNSISSTSAGASYELDAIAAVIIGGSSMSGGKASIAGTFAGILILGIVSNVLSMWGISINLQGLVKGLVILVAVLIQRVR